MAQRAYKYAVRGRPSDAVHAEIQRAHILRNKITEIYRAADEKIVAAYKDIPDIAAAQTLYDEKKQTVDDLRAALGKHKQAQRTGRVDKTLAAKLTAARQELLQAHQELKAAKKVNRTAASGPVKEASEEAAEAIQGLYEPAVVTGSLFEDTPVQGCLYWATFNAVTRKMATAMNQVITLRSQHKPAALNFHRWDGGGTITVTLQREIGVAEEARSMIAELAADGMKPGAIAKELAEHGHEIAPRSVGRIIATLERNSSSATTVKAKAPDPRRSPEILSSGTGKWRNVLQVVPLEGKDAEVSFRIGSYSSKAIETVRIRLHRPLPPDADITGMELTVRPVSSGVGRGPRKDPYINDPYLKASVTLIAQLPEKPPPVAHTLPVAIHTGWRVLDDGSIRVAVIAGASTPPPGLGETHKDHDGMQEYGLRDHGTWQEVVIPAGRRDRMQHARSLQSVRSEHMDTARKKLTAHLAQHPEHKEIIDPAGTLDRWRSPERFTAALADTSLAARNGIPNLEDAVEILGHWHERELHLRPWQDRERERRVIGWRRDMYKKIAAWLSGHAGAIIMDSWPAVRTVPEPDEEESAQMRLARANAVLASPGELRQVVKSAAQREHVPVIPGPEGAAAVHHGCGGDLPPDERTAGVMVACRRCGQRIDQDRNVLAAMLASAQEVS